VHNDTHTCAVLEAGCGLGLVLVSVCAFVQVVAFHVFICIRFSFFSTMPRDWLERIS